ncbi:olfactory receptor 2G3-like [Pleurodeles waltl]|uniref:olfactory receptor 2G3-like n=1 Tax=Pleurodeles waltl TaxID=8319 RepID=UPI0037097872
MERGNQTFVTEFILVGLSQDPKTQAVLFGIFLVIYLCALMGNLLIITVIQVDSRLHTPMYFLLSNLSFLDITYTTVISPKMLSLFLSTTKTISFTGCMTQVYFYLFLGETECLLLAAMAYDRYVAICNPLRYTSVMNKVVCLKLAGVMWISCFVISLMDILITVQLPFCGPNQIDHFFCEAPFLLKLACADISTNVVVTVIGVSLFLIFPLALIVISYICIITTILRMRSVEGRHRAFSTCSSHLAVVFIFYGTAILLYTKPVSEDSTSDKIFSVFYTIVTPMLNPLIYSLRNKDVKRAIRKTIENSLLQSKLTTKGRLCCYGCFTLTIARF